MAKGGDGPGRRWGRYKVRASTGRTGETGALAVVVVYPEEIKHALRRPGHC